MYQTKEEIIMPIIDFTQPFYLIAAIALFLLCLYLGRNNKTNTVPCIMLFCFLAILVGHTIELVSGGPVSTLATCIIVDEAFTFISFLSFLWLDRIQVEEKKKASKGKKKSTQKDKKEKLDDIVIENDGLDALWKKI